MLFRRLAVFLGGFDVDAAHAVAGGADVERFQVLDQLTLLVDKSLVVAEDTRRGTRYRLLETVRQYAQEKLHESREGDDIRGRHRDHYTAMAAALDTAGGAEYEHRIDRAEAEMDNLRAAFAWSRESGDAELALVLASSLQPVWLRRGRILEGLDWLSAAMADECPQDGGPTAAYLRATADKALLLSFVGTTEGLDEARNALATARAFDAPALELRLLTACGGLANAHDRELASTYFAEAAEIAQQLGDLRSLAQVIALDWMTARVWNEPVAARVAAVEGLRIAEDIGDTFLTRQLRYVLGWALILSGDLIGASDRLKEVIEESATANDVVFSFAAGSTRTFTLAYLGDQAGALASADVLFTLANGSQESYLGIAHAALGTVRLVGGDASAAWQAYESSRQHSAMDPMTASVYTWAALAPLACGDLAAARHWADDVVAANTGWGLGASQSTRARILVAQGELDAAERDAHDALEVAARIGGDLIVPFALDCLAIVAARTDNHRSAARLFGAADAARRHMSMVRFKVLEECDDAIVATVRDALGGNDFDAAWAEGAALSIEEATAYALRGRGERKRASSGWASLTRAELDVVRLVSEGLGNKEVAARLFVSPRTVQAHLTHVYTKLGLASRVQLAQEAAKHG